MHGRRRKRMEREEEEEGQCTWTSLIGEKMGGRLREK